MGYRHFDKNSLEVSYPFGFGLSYTDFSYNNMDIKVIDEIIEISVQLENTGMVPGKEVVEIYVSKPDTDIDRPLQEANHSSALAKDRSPHRAKFEQPGQAYRLIRF